MFPPGFIPGAARRPAQRFDEYYRCYPMVMAPGADRPELNYGSKIILPPSALDRVSKLHVQWPLLMEIVNGEQGKHSHAGVLEFVAEEGRAYLPHWMMQTLGLDVGDMVQVKTTSLALARQVKLQPQSVEFLEITDPKAVLEKAFRGFATLTQGDVFDMEYNRGVYAVKVLEVKPTSEKMGVCMLETDVEVDFAPPVGYVEPERAQKAASTPVSTTSGTVTPSHSLPAGGLLHHQGTMAQAIGYDAIAPSKTQQPVSAFHGVGQSLDSYRAGGDASSDTIAAPLKAKRMPNNAPLPLRLPTNKLFFGYELKPLRSKEAKEGEAKKPGTTPLFQGGGQTLRSTKKSKGKDKDDN